jgi:hypothetical protein
MHRNGKLETRKKIEKRTSILNYLPYKRDIMQPNLLDIGYSIIKSNFNEVVPESGAFLTETRQHSVNGLKSDCP